jgi:hypothetical protein
VLPIPSEWGSGFEGRGMLLLVPGREERREVIAAAAGGSRGVDERVERALLAPRSAVL